MTLSLFRSPRASNQIAARPQRRGAVLAECLDDVAADPPAVHLVGTVDQPLRAHLGVPLRQSGILAEAERAVQLDRGVDHMVHHVREIHFGDRVLLPQVKTLFRLVGDVQQHQPPDIELGGAFGEHELHRLAVGQQHAEGRALCHMRHGHVERALGLCNVVHAVTQPAIGEAVLAHVETVAFAAEQVVGRTFRSLISISEWPPWITSACGPSIAMFLMLRLILYPGFGNSTMKVEYCLWRGASGSVLAITSAMSATLADDENHFSPLRM